MEKQIESTRNFKAGYQIHHGRWSYDSGVTDPWTPMKWATNPEGDYIGNPRTAYRLCQKRGIRPETTNGHRVCSIGFCEKEQKWYGWSHRAIYGFGIGDVVKEGDCCASSGYTEEWLAENEDPDVLPVGFTAKTLGDAKLMAQAFAASVG